MSAHVTLQAQVAQYLAERRHAGFELSSMGHGLERFARYVEQVGHHGPLTVDLMAAWASQAKGGHEKFSGLKFNQDFFCGYSPERINPGDKEHRVTTIKKVTSGSTPEIADLVDALYNQIITVGTFKATSIKVAEAAKVIENTQRDANIAIVNELALIFNKMGIDTEAVLQAAGTNSKPWVPPPSVRWASPNTCCTT
jgi:hypothetical protein